MALAATTVWEVRTTGQQTNGGGFNAARGGTDYSQQDAAQLSLSDIATDGAGTGLSSGTGGFTAAMAGNIIYLTGGSSTAGWYEITAVASSNACSIDRSAGANKTGVTGNVGGAFAIGGALDHEFFGSFAAGNICHIKGATHTLGEAIAPSNAGTAANPIRIIGYNATRGDTPTGDNRPLLACGANYFRAYTYWFVENLRATGTGAAVLQSVLQGIFINCSAYNSSGTAGRSAFLGGAASCWTIGCEGISDNGYAFGTCSVLACYGHNSQDAFNACYSGMLSIADTVSRYGFHLTAGANLANCTVYNAGTGVYLSVATYMSTIANCIIDGCTTGVDAVSAIAGGLLIRCSLHNTTDLAPNVADIVQIANRAADPGLGDPANGDFSIDSGDDVYGQGLDVMRYIAGVTV